MKKFKHSEITSEKIYNKRRSFIKSMGYGLGALTLNSVPLVNANAGNLNKPTSYKDITTYNNYYEFGTGKSCLLYTSPSPRDGLLSRMPSSA